MNLVFFGGVVKLKFQGDIAKLLTFVRWDWGLVKHRLVFQSFPKDCDREVGRCVECVKASAVWSSSAYDTTAFKLVSVFHKTRISNLLYLLTSRQNYICQLHHVNAARAGLPSSEPTCAEAQGNTRAETFLANKLCG